MIHQYKMGDLDIVLDINSGSVHVVDDISYDIIEMMDKKLPKAEILTYLSETYASMEDLEEAYGEVETLINEGMLFTEEDYSEVVTDFKNRSTVVKALCLHVAHDCNLACKYCFASEGEYHGDRALMPLEIGKKAIDFLVANSQNRRNLEIDFFGGEPLMNFDMVKDVVAYARSIEKRKKTRTSDLH